MGLKLRVSGRAGGPVDVEIDAPGDVTIGALARELADRASTGAITLSSDGRLLHPATKLDAAGLRSGSAVEIVADDGPDEPVTATVTIGPDAGRRVALPRGQHLVGRDRSCVIVLTDDSVSRRHVRIDVGDRVEIVDLGSANGTIVAGDRVASATVESSTTIRIGATELRIDAPNADEPTDEAFVRSPPQRRAFTAEDVAAPKLPVASKPGRIPAIAALAPVVLGLVMFLVTGQAQSLLFVLLSPLMLLANAGEARWSNRRGTKRSAAEFRSALATFADSSRERLADETAARRDEHPDIAELVVALERRSPLLWSRRPDEPHFAELAVGRARQPARTTFTSGRTEGADADLVAALDGVLGSLRDVDDVPVAVDLATAGSIGVAGPPATARPIVATTAASAVLLHSPAELVVTLFTADDAADDWAWLTWLPHVDARYSPFEGRHLAASPANCASLHASLLQLLEARESDRSHRGDARHVPTVLMIVDDDAPIDRSLLVDLLERGPAAGIHTIWTAPTIDRLPAGCGAVVDTRRGSAAVSVRTRLTNEVTEGVRTSVLPPAELVRIARSASPLVDVGARARRATGLPDTVAGADVLGLAPDASPEVLIERWRHTAIETPGAADTGLRAPVGGAADGDFVLDLRTHGPHALVGGTTGAGKSEFLQAWVMGLAAAYGPARVNFLFVDYKGGAAFSECVKLPHCVGLVTDLSPHLVDRALTSLHAELHRREQLFNSLDAKDIHDLERRGEAETPPALVIVVDEFAALVQEVPDFVDGVVNVAQRGRSLGLHLILATQRPAGVITGNLRANTNLRIALRMADESDSSDVIDATDAAFIDAGSPGRAYAKIGPGRTVAFQSAYYGGWSGETATDHAITIRPLSVHDVEPWPSRRNSRSRIDDPNDLAQLVNMIQRAALLGHEPAPRRPWLPELPTNLDLREAPLTRSDGEIVFGRRDLPSEQAQPPLSWFPDRDGNLVVFGASGSGKSTLLRTIAEVAGTLDDAPAPTDGPCHVYCIDFGSRSLQLLEEFPHVGSVIGADDHERITRLVRELRATIDARQQTFRAADADSIAQYRERTGSQSTPRILLLIDNFGAFRQAYDVPGRDAILAGVNSIMSDGRPVGVHVALTADRPGAVPSSTTSLITRRLALRLSNESDYLLLGEPATVLDNDTPAGRGLEGGREFQVAVLGGTSDLAEQTRLARALARHDDFGGARTPAPPVRTLPTSVRLDDLPAMAGRFPTLGLDDETLSPVGVEPRGAFVVAGPPGSGRTTAMGALAVSLRRAEPRFQQVLFAGRRSPLLHVTNWTTVAERPGEHAELAAAITKDLLAAEGDVVGLAIFIEEAPEVVDAAESATAMGELIKAAIAADVFLVVDGDTSSLARAWKLDAVKNQRTGLLLQPRTGDGDALKAALPRIDPDQFPIGRGLLIDRRNFTTIQVAAIELGR